MADDGNDQPEQQQKQAGSLYHNINVNGPDQPTFIGDGTKVLDCRKHTHIENNRTSVTINYFPVTQTEAERLQSLLEGNDNVPAISNEDKADDFYDDTVSRVSNDDFEGYQQPSGVHVPDRIGVFTSPSQTTPGIPKQKHSTRSPIGVFTSPSQTTPGIPKQKHTTRPGKVVTGSVSKERPSTGERSTDSYECKAPLTFAERVELFCNTTSDLKQKSLKEVIHFEVNNLSVHFTTNCTIFLAESRLRNFLRQVDPLKVINGIDIYGSILTVMLLNGLQPQISGKETLNSLSTRLKKIVAPPHFFPMSRVRRDVETVIKLLSAFGKKLKEDKIKKLTELILQIERDLKIEAVTENLRAYLDPQSWSQHYLLLFWLKVQALVKKKESLVHVFLHVVKYMSKSLKKMNLSYRWKFTITVVDSFVQIAREISDPSEIHEKLVDGLADFHFILQEKKLNECIEIFYKQARILVFFENLKFRSRLLEGIFKDLDTTSEELCKERIKYSSESLKLSTVRSSVHNGNHSWIFYADSDGSAVIAKCYKQTRTELVAKYGETSPRYFDYECKSLRQLKHRYIVQLVAFDEHSQCMVLKSVPKGRLLTHLRNNRVSARVPKVVDLLSMARMVAEALEFLEKKKIIHLALQSGNILLHDNGKIKLTGFQFCRTQEDIKKTGVQGSLQQSHFKWMDPQALKFESISPKTVSWSFGVLLYELFTLGCIPYNNLESRPDHGDFKRKPLTAREARIFVIRGGKLRKEICIPGNISSIISNVCLQSNYESRASPYQLKQLLDEQINVMSDSDELCRPPPRLIRLSEDLNPENCNPGIGDYDNDFPFAHLEFVDHGWNEKYDDENFDCEEAYINADPSQSTPLLCIIKRQNEERKWKEVRVLEYMEFKEMKLVEKLRTLKCPHLVKVVAVNPFGPDKVEMISESLPQGNVLDALIQQPTLRKHLKRYILQAGAAVMYLHKRKIVHKNLKVENYLMVDEESIKLGFLGMSAEEVDVNAEYCDPRSLIPPEMVKDNRRNAPEVLYLGLFKRASDVWSFGVTVWEFLKIANSPPNVAKKDVLPYSDVPDNKVPEWVKDKNLLPNPDPRSTPFYNVCKKCWEWEPQNRPIITAVVEELENIHRNKQELRINEEEELYDDIGVDFLQSTNERNQTNAGYNEEGVHADNDVYQQDTQQRNQKEQQIDEELYEHIDRIISQQDTQQRNQKALQIDQEEGLYENLPLVIESEVPRRNTYEVCDSPAFDKNHYQSSSQFFQFDIASVSSKSNATAQSGIYSISSSYTGYVNEAETLNNDDSLQETKNTSNTEQNVKCGDTEHEYSEVYDHEIDISSHGNASEVVVGETEHASTIEQPYNTYRSQACEDLHVNQELNSTEVLNEAQDETTDIAFKIGSAGHVGNLIAKFSSS